jgi:hypothetical protein
MYAFTVTGYAWDGDIYCPNCINAVVDAATPEVHDRHWHGTPGPVFAADETEYVCYCGACGTEIFTNVIDREGVTT